MHVFTKVSSKSSHFETAIFKNASISKMSRTQRGDELNQTEITTSKGDIAISFFFLIVLDTANFLHYSNLGVIAIEVCVRTLFMDFRRVVVTRVVVLGT